ncbi:NmrA family NAD(P)-binding protein [Tianweitania sediminis]|uniref:NmrA family NAD(P)-binding protein n=1 Tax=Tianweitania sediminis TaxID=1502156 RepID=A0A8J7R8W4_9HYPH|nr:NmrA family NAD(P)-binding protein [Tianweitania sediminis]MBP0440367.1 NmrA family NAD(P)-binding protein [Tianweitania sediminis]
MAHRILITGATGTVGGATLRALKADAEAGKVELLGAARSSEGADKLRDAGFAPVSFDFDDVSTLRPALKGVDSVFLLTGYSVDMLVQAKRLLDAAKAEGVRHIVHLGAFAAPDTPHAHFAWHQLIERATEAMGFDWTHLHPNFFMDTVWNGFARRPDRLVHFIGDRRASFVSSDDMAAVAAEALRNPQAHKGKSYPLAVEAVTFNELAAVLSEVTGRQVTYMPRPAAELFPVMQRQGAEANYAKSLAEGIAAIESGEFAEAGATFDNVETLIGRKPIDWRDFATTRLGELPAAG